MFHKLGEKDLKNILDLLIANLLKRLETQGILVEVDDSVKDFILKQDDDKNYGARPLRRSVQKLIEDKLSDEILRGSIAIGDKVNIDFKEDKLVFEKE